MARQFTASSSQYGENTSAVPFQDGAYTISAWVWFDTNTPANERFIALSESGGHHIMLAYAAGSWFFRLNDGGNKDIQQVVGVSADTWIHVCALSESVSSRRLYIDNVEVAASPNTATASSNTWTDTRVAVHETVSANHLDGRLARVGWWNVALNADERTALFEGAPPGSVRPESLAAWHEFDDDNSSTVIDRWYNGIDLTLQGGSGGWAEGPEGLWYPTNSRKTSVVAAAPTITADMWGIQQSQPNPPSVAVVSY